MTMALWQSIPFACILLPLGSAAMTSILKRRAAKVWTLTVLTILTVLSVFFAAKMQAFGTSYNYKMGHYSAPWGNEIRAGLLEAILSLTFCVVMLLSFLGGARRLNDHVLEERQSLYCVIVLLLTASLNAQVYTNDIFTGYVFLEIMTISAAALIASYTHGKTLVAAARYMIMNMIGSALFLLGVILLYDLTGHLLMEDAHDAIAGIAAGGTYRLPMIVIIALVTCGLGVKSALFPFHEWVPDAYSLSTPTSAALLSALVSKGYIVLLVKIIVRVFGTELFMAEGMGSVVFIYGILGMVFGSVLAIRQSDVRRMTAYSSVAQIGYIYMGIGLGTEYGMMAAMFQLISHSVCKAMLFIAVDGLKRASNNSADFHELRGSGYRAPLSGIAFTVGALSMVGFPFLGGFPAKINFALAALDFSNWRCWLVLAVLIISTWLNTLYFLRAVVTIYRKPPASEETELNGPKPHYGAAFVVSAIAFSALNIMLGFFSQPLIDMLFHGLTMF